MEQKIDPQPKFLDSCYQVFSNYTCYFFKKKKQLDSSEAVKCSKETNVVQISIFFIFKSFFYRMEQGIDSPNLGFWILAKVLSNYTCYISKKPVGCK